MGCQSSKEATGSPFCHIQWAKTSQLALFPGSGNRLHLFTGRTTKSCCKGYTLRIGYNWRHLCNYFTTNHNLDYAKKPSVSLVYFVTTHVSCVISLWTCIPSPVKRIQRSAPKTCFVGSLVFPLHRVEVSQARSHKGKYPLNNAGQFYRP